MARHDPIFTTRTAQAHERQTGRCGVDWTCSVCRKVLGRILGGDVHLRFNRRHEYVASLPASAICRNCGTLNRARSSAQS